MKSHYVIHPTPTLTADVQEFLVIEWGRTENGRDDSTGKMVGAYPSIEAAMEFIHGQLLRQHGAHTVLHVGSR